MIKERVINLNDIQWFELVGYNSSHGKAVIDIHCSHQDKNKKEQRRVYRLHINRWDIKYFASTLWDFIEKEKKFINNVEKSMKDNQ